MWAEAGKPRQGELFKLMCLTRARFKYALRYIKQHENKLRKDALAKKLADKSNNEFWKDIKNVNNVKTPLPNVIDGAIGGQEICELWRKHFTSIFNCIKDDVRAINVNCSSDNNVTVTIHEVALAISKLDKNKSCGLDGIYAEHLIYCSNRLLLLLAFCITAFFVHGFLPDNMMSVVLVPIIKDKAGKIGDKNNYRPIAIASIMSKILERIILDRIINVLDTKCNQFGFKPKLGTDMCIYSLKEIIDKYRQLNGSVFMCFLDASKAFDRVKHSILFKKLLQRGAPTYIVRILLFWYINQTMYVRWGGILSAPFKVSNGVRQGGILSPYLFNIYMDDLSVELNKCKYGCLIGNHTVNHLMYADDLVIFCPSPVGLSSLLHICGKYGIDHDIKYNSKKSAVVICRSKFNKNVSYDDFTINGESISQVSSVKYLGHYICEDLKDDTDINRQCRQIYAQGNTLARKFGMCSNDVKSYLFNSYCTSMYTAHLWWNYNAGSIKKLYVAYNNSFRFLHHLPRDCSASAMFADNNVKNCSAIIRNLVYKFSKRLDLSENSIVRMVLNSDLYLQSRIRKHWCKLLFVDSDFILY